VSLLDLGTILRSHDLTIRSKGKKKRKRRMKRKRWKVIKSGIEGEVKNKKMNMQKMVRKIQGEERERMDLMKIKMKDGSFLRFRSL